MRFLHVERCHVWLSVIASDYELSMRMLFSVNGEELDLQKKNR